MPIKHIVLFKFKEAATEAQIDEIKAALTALDSRKGGKIEGITDLTMGKTFTDRHQGYTHALSVDLVDAAALDTYGPHADHQAVITNLIKPLLEAPPLAMDYEF